MLERTLELSIGDSFWIGHLLVTVVDVDGTNVTVCIEEGGDDEEFHLSEYEFDGEPVVCAAEQGGADD